MRRKLTLLIAALILNISIMSAYIIPAQAMTYNPIVDGLYNSFSTIFGNSWGLFKSTDAMTANYTMDKISDFILHQVLGQPYTWDNAEEISGLNTREGMLDFLNSSLATVRAYNLNGMANDLYDQLNAQSYSASGTLATKTMEANLEKSISIVSKYSEGEYSAAFEELDESLFGSESGAAVGNISASYQLYEALMSGLIANSEMDETSTWFEPVTSSIYGTLDLNTGRFEYEDLVHTVHFSNYWYLDNMWTEKKYEVTFAENVYFITYRTGDNINIVAISDKPIGATIRVVNYNGSVERTIERSLDLMESGVYEFAAGDSSYAAVLPALSISNDNSYDTTNFRKAFRTAYQGTLSDLNFRKENIAAGEAVSTDLQDALDSFWEKDITVEDVANLAETMTTVQDTAGTEEAIQSLTDAVAGITVTLPDVIEDGKNDVVKAVEGLGDSILTLPKSIWLEFEGVLEGIETKVNAKPWEGDYESPSSDIIVLLNGLFFLIMIIMALLRIFIHCLQFIINIFKIPASTAFLPDEVIMGLDYLKSLEIPGIGMSVYDFMMGLVYIMIVFFAIRLLRVNIDRIRIPRTKNGGLG